MITVPLRAVNRLSGETHVPGDKSISHRAVMLSSLARGRTEITGFLPGEDCLSTIDCFRSMGVEIVRQGDEVRVEGKGWFGLLEPTNVLDVGNSGTTIRLMLGILSTQPFYSVLTGDPSIARRPMRRVAIPLLRMGAIIDGRNVGEYTPISVRGGSLQGIHYQLPVSSAQVKSAVLLAGMQAAGVTTVTEPMPSRDHTERMLQAFGAKVDIFPNGATVQGGMELASPELIRVPGDISSAAFLLAAAAIIPGSEVLIRDVGVNPTRTGIIDVLKDMGASISLENQRIWNEEPVADILIKGGELRSTVIEGAMIPRLIDEIPVIAVMAALAEGQTVIRDAKELRVKETDRIATMAAELQRMGADVQPTEDGMVINGPCRLQGATCESHGDHRVGMAMSVAALAAEGETNIRGAEAINVSFPGFFETLRNLTR